ncbi:MAG: acyl-CoA dehydrogenase family protein [Planctomycetota bacterium]
MSNFYSDNPDIEFHLSSMDLHRIVDLYEDDFAEKDVFPYAPSDYEDCIDNYRRVLEIVGEIAGEFVAPRATEADREGASWNDGVVSYAAPTREALDRMSKADLMGFTLPRKYGGINMPKVCYSLAIEMISRADAGLMNLFGLQDIAETIHKFGNEEQRQRCLPRFASGEASGSMDLTEPDAGSDLQAVSLKAHEDEHGVWRLNGVKRFITNGCADIHLVLARSEDGSTSGSGLSLFVYEKEDQHFRVRRIEDKLGIHASPTCELQFSNAPAELLGRRKYGLIRYTMSLMNGARLGIAAQGLGIAEAAYREALAYASVREQFGKVITRFAPVQEMLTSCRAKLAAGRTLLMETSRIVDIKEGVEHRIDAHPESKRDLAGDLKHHTKLAALFTPLCKLYNTEIANQVAYDAIQIHGGVGFTREFNVERHYRDARITNIYEGTTQLQVVAAIGGVTGGVLAERLDAYTEGVDFTPVAETFAKTQQMRDQLETALGLLKGQEGSAACIDYHARRLVDLAIDIINSHLLCLDALKDPSRRELTDFYVTRALAQAHGTTAYIKAQPTPPVCETPTA